MNVDGFGVVISLGTVTYESVVDSVVEGFSLRCSLGVVSYSVQPHIDLGTLHCSLGVVQTQVIKPTIDRIDFFSIQHDIDWWQIRKQNL